MKRRDEVLVGILLTAAVVVVIVGTLWLVRGGLSAGYPLHAFFPWGAGLKQGQPVLLAGVNVGYVDNVELRDDGLLSVVLRIERGRRIPEGSLATVVPIGIFGDAAVALTPERPSPVSYEPGDTVPLGVSPPTMQDILARIDTVGRTMSDVTTAIELQLVERGGLDDLRGTLAATNRLVHQLSEIAAIQSRELTATTIQLRRSAAAFDSARIDSTMQSLQRSSENLAGFTGQLEVASATLTSVLAKIDTGAGTAGKLVTDTLLYSDVRSLVTRIDSLTADFKANPRRYINLSIF